MCPSRDWQDKKQIFFMGYFFFLIYGQSLYHATMNVLTQSKVVLLVDDEKNFFDVYAWQLEDFPSLEFIHAESGYEAYELMGQQKIDVVISDINMPNGDGLWLLEKLSAEYADIPVIIASSHVGMNEIELINLGAVAFIPKIELNSLNLKFRALF